MKGSYITVTAKDGGMFKAYLAKPAKGSGPGIVLLQEIFGINPYMRNVTDHYAEEGYVVLAPDLFWRLEPGVELDETQFEKAFTLYQEFDVAKAVEDIVSSVTALRAEPACAGKIGALGFCLGGVLAYRAAAHAGVDCAISYCSVGIETSLDLVPNIKCPLVLHFAANDKFVPEAAREQVKSAFAGNPNAEIYVYPEVDHAFARPVDTPTTSRPPCWLIRDRSPSSARSWVLSRTSAPCEKRPFFIFWSNRKELRRSCALYWGLRTKIMSGTGVSCFRRSLDGQWNAFELHVLKALDRGHYP